MSLKAIDVVIKFICNLAGISLAYHTQITQIYHRPTVEINLNKSRNNYIYMFTALFVSFCVFSLIFVFCVYTFLFCRCNVSLGRLLVLNFSLVVPAIFDPLLHICICFPSK